MSVIQSKEYHCEDCLGCEDGICEFTREPLNFDITTKTPCPIFVPAEYIEALNFDTR